MGNANARARNANHTADVEADAEGPAPRTGRPLVVLDIDATLLEAVGTVLGGAADYALYRPVDATRGTAAEIVCCAPDYPPDAPQQAPPNGDARMYMWGRPGLPQFLRLLSQEADIAIWSMGLQEYVELVALRVVAPLLSPGESLVAVLHRGDCFECEQDPAFEQYPKHLSYIAQRTGRPVERIVLIEDTPSNAPPWQNVVQVPPYQARLPAATQDRALAHLLAARAVTEPPSRKRQLDQDHPKPVRFAVGV